MAERLVKCVNCSNLSESHEKGYPWRCWKLHMTMSNSEIHDESYCTDYEAK